MTERTSPLAGLWIGATISNTSHSNEHGSLVKDQGRRQCCHNTHKKFPFRPTREVSLLSGHSSYFPSMLQFTVRLMTSVGLPVASSVVLSSPNRPDRLWHYLAIFFLHRYSTGVNKFRTSCRPRQINLYRGAKLFVVHQYRTSVISPFCRL